LTVAVEKIGERPAGATAAGSPIVQTALAVSKALGLSASLEEGSTDANVPMNLRIPAITVGAGGVVTGAHSLQEAFDTTDSWRGAQRMLLLAVALAGI
jgi:di/tripeptidase